MAHVDTNDEVITKSVEQLESALLGHRIVQAVAGVDGSGTLCLDNGHTVRLVPRGDCCAYTCLESFLAHPELVDHAITGVYTTDKGTCWHIMADMSDVMNLSVEWSAGSGYYIYGFNIVVEDTK